MHTHTRRGSECTPNGPERDGVQQAKLPWGEVYRKQVARDVDASLMPIGSSPSVSGFSPGNAGGAFAVACGCSSEALGAGERNAFLGAVTRAPLLPVTL